MAVEEVLREIREEVLSAIPETEITDIQFEGALVVIYSKNPEKFAEEEIIRQLAKKLQKRIVVRPDPSVLADINEATEKIKRIIPRDAGFNNAYFEPDIGEVTIEVEKPGLAIGRRGAVLNEIKKSIGWAPRIIRTPPIPSKTVKDIRKYTREMADERKEFLRKLGRKMHRGVSDGEKWIRITSLGGYREVGRSCTLLSTQDSKVMIDCGTDVSNTGSPYLHLPEALPLDSIDGVVVTHAHLDHSGLVPLLFKYGYNGPIYCTYPTRDVMTLLQMDYIKVSAGEGRNLPYSSEYIRETIKHCVPLNYGDTTDISPDIRLTMYRAGHILGSAICHFHIGEGLYNIAFTGDIKYEYTWLFDPAATRFPRLEAIVMESTYGGENDFQPSRKEATEQLKEIVKRVLNKGGKVLIPVFAVGRSQEVMMVLEHLMRNKEIPECPIYLDGMIWEATAIHAAYPEYLNDELKGKIFQGGENPFLSEIFERVDSYEMRQNILMAKDPCIILTTSGMLNGGPIMEYLKEWGDDERNCLIFVGYQAEGTLGRKIQKGWDKISIGSEEIKIRMDIETCDGFSGHSDRRQLMNFIKNVEPHPDRAILNHGEEVKCLNLASGIYKKYGIRTRAIKNLETIRLK